MKKITALFITIFLILGCFGLAACSTKKVEEIELTETNLHNYIAFNFNYFEYTVQPITETPYKYMVSFRVEITTSPKIPNINFYNVSIRYFDAGNDKSDEISIPFHWSILVNSNLNSEGYSSTSFYVYSFSKIENIFPQLSFDNMNVYIDGYVYETTYS